MKRLAIIGSTGSIGVSTLDVVAAHPDRFEVVALGAGGNTDLLAEQVERFGPELVAVKDAQAAGRLRQRIGDRCTIVAGVPGQVDVATFDDADMLVSALVGAIGLQPTYEAIRAGRDVALANKETLVMAGRAMTEAAAASGAKLLPVDSEHNAIHQCLRGEDSAEVRRLWLTASGGPFRGWPSERIRDATPEQALNHPTWKMGPKITVDSATLMNKGLEVIEARWLFAVPPDRIRVVVHPQSVVHSMVEFVDGSFKAQLGVTDMRHPIQYALSWPERWASSLPDFDPVAAGPLEFEEPDMGRFPCLGLAYAALEAGGTAPAVLNAANEVAVELFLAGRIGFMHIAAAIEATLETADAGSDETVDGVLEADGRARTMAREWLEQGVGS
ncbi:MAG: 1-deoxy-D-xylulose-5-phosphate reductoisomerase [Acidobacteria bacterium]|nr:MAG: 1-deoxy-D-xylulose-5-phosphate reductoisomerase [Acidobacteriota bacterium]